jgi:hypothetical protein
MKVVDWDKWQRTKMVVCLLFALAGLAFGGGLEAQPDDPPPNWLGVITCLTIAFSILWNVIQIDRQRGSKKWW